MAEITSPRISGVFVFFFSVIVESLYGQYTGGVNPFNGSISHRFKVDLLCAMIYHKKLTFHEVFERAGRRTGEPHGSGYPGTYVSGIDECSPLLDGGMRCRPVDYR
jgi:hypothetical protein